MGRSTFSLFLLASIALEPSAWAAAAAPKCDSHAEGAVQVAGAVVQVKKKPRIELIREQRHDTVTDALQLTLTVRQGKRTITQIVVATAADGSTTTTRTLGFGFKGLHEIVVRRTADTATVTADGHPVSLAALRASPPAIVFEDGAPAPRLKIKGSVRRVLTKVAKLAPTVSCPGFSASLRASRDAFDAAVHQGELKPEANSRKACDLCWDKCGAIGFACFGADVVICAVTAGVGCGVDAVLSFLDSDVSCTRQLIDCGDLCNAVGHECCGPTCGGYCCGADSDPDDTVCAGATPTFGGVCCQRELLCGKICCGAFGTVCKDPSIELCCQPEHVQCGRECCNTGERCADPSKALCCNGEACGSFCCPLGKRCAVPSDVSFDEVECIDCSPAQSGPVCGQKCCGPNEVCGFNNECCAANQLCGGECCDAAHCLNGNTCCKNGTPCGSHCCNGLGETCCNGQCCTGLCVTGVCCPENRACGPTCCAPDNYCANSQTGLCVQCPLGESPCAGSESGGPACCPTGQACCVAGCCGPRQDCCAPTGLPLGCYASSSCVR